MIARDASFPSAMPSSGAQIKHMFVHVIISFVDKTYHPWNLCLCSSLNGTGSHCKRIISKAKLFQLIRILRFGAFM